LLKLERIQPKELITAQFQGIISGLEKRTDMIGQIVIIGNGIAANSAAQAIRKVNKKAAIPMISQEPLPLYSPAVLSKKLISSEIEIEKVFLKKLEHYTQENIDLFLGASAEVIDGQNKRVFLEDGRDIGYDRLIIATGSTPLIPSIEGINLEGIFNLKSLSDAEKIRHWNGDRAVVTGAGPIGIEAAISLRKKGWQVSLVEQMDQILPKAFDEKPSLILRKVLEDYGIEVSTGEEVVRFAGDKRVHKVITNKREITNDMVVLCTGLKAEVELARKAGIEIGALGGIKVDKHMMTNIEDVYACGDCVQAKDIITGKDILSPLWHNAREQGEIAGYNAAGVEKGYRGILNITGVSILGTEGISIGHTMDSFKDEAPDTIESDRDCYYRLLISQGVLVGAQFIGRTEDAGPLLSAIRRKNSLEWLQRIMDNGNLRCKNEWYCRMYPSRLKILKQV